MRTVIFLSRTSGLGNRVRGFVAYKALSRVVKAEFALCWMPNPACDEHFGAIFDTRGIALLKYPDLYAAEKSGGMRVFSEADWWDDVWLAHASSVVTFNEFMAHVAAVVCELRFSGQVMEKAEPFIKEHSTRERVAFHIRNTDNVLEYNRWSRHARGRFERERVSQLAGFMAAADAAAKDRVGVYLASDDAEVERTFSERFPAPDLVSYPKLHHEKKYAHNTARTTHVVDAAVEMAILGSCKRVVGTYYSSFGRIAAALGGTEYAEIQGGTCVSDPTLPSRSGLSSNRPFVRLRPEE